MVNQSVEDIATQWIHEEIFQYKDKVLPASISKKYIKALLDVAGSDGVLIDAEKKWVLGYAVARGVPQEEIAGLKGYKLGSENSTAPFNAKGKSKTAEHFQAALIYDGFRAAAADAPLKDREIDAISAVAKFLGMSDDKFQELLALYKEEEELRQKRIALLFPKSYAETIKAIDTHYGR